MTPAAEDAPHITPHQQNHNITNHKVDKYKIINNLKNNNISKYSNK